MNRTNDDKIAQKLVDYHKRLRHSLVLGFCIIIFSLTIGMVGYHYFENLGWVDAYLNAAMILSGMGEIDTLKTEEGKIFAGSYALFSGIVFLVIAGLIFAPLFHRFFHKLHIEDQSK
jgi:hypothetical protein